MLARLDGGDVATTLEAAAAGRRASGSARDALPDLACRELHVRRCRCRPRASPTPWDSLRLAGTVGPTGPRRCPRPGDRHPAGRPSRDRRPGRAVREGGLRRGAVPRRRLSDPIKRLSPRPPPIDAVRWPPSPPSTATRAGSIPRTKCWTPTGTGSPWRGRPSPSRPQTPSSWHPPGRNSSSPWLPPYRCGAGPPRRRPSLGPPATDRWPGTTRGPAWACPPRPGAGAPTEVGNASAPVDSVGGHGFRGRDGAPAELDARAWREETAGRPPRRHRGRPRRLRGVVHSTVLDGPPLEPAVGRGNSCWRSRPTPIPSQSTSN